MRISSASNNIRITNMNNDNNNENCNDSNNRHNHIRDHKDEDNTNDTNNDVNPMDFFVWSDVERRMAKQKDPRNESIGAYKARMRRTAMNTPAKLIRRAVTSMRTRATAVVLAEGGDIPRD